MATFLPRRLSTQAKLTLSANPYRDLRRLLEDCATASVDALMAKVDGPVRDAEAFAALREVVRAGWVDTVLGLVHDVQPVLQRWYQLDQALSGLIGSASQAAYADLRAQLAELVGPGFVTAAGTGRLADLARYLHAMQRRLERLPGNMARDLRLTRQVEAVQAEYRDLVAAHGADPAATDQLTGIRWMIQELRVNLFAQAIGTAYPISDKRIYRAMDELEERLSDGSAAAS